MLAHAIAARQDARAGQPAAPAVAVRLACFVACAPAAAPAARSVVVQALTGRVDGRVLADAELVVSELVTNSVQHAGLSADEFVRAGAAVSEGVLRLEVDSPGITGTIAALPDSGPGAFGLLQSQRPPDPTAPSGCSNHKGHLIPLARDRRRSPPWPRACRRRSGASGSR
jgi:anti-sigma regulatory factor (Ser/Thr protein kinase)